MATTRRTLKLRASGSLTRKRIIVTVAVSAGPALLQLLLLLLLTAPQLPIVQAGAHQSGHDVEQALLAIRLVRELVVLQLSDALRRHSGRRLGRRSCS